MTVIRSRSISIRAQEVRLIVRKEETSFSNFPAFSNGIMMATLQIRGQSA